MSITLPAPLAKTPPETLEPRAYTAYQLDFGSTSPTTIFQSAVIMVDRRPHVANAAREHTYWHVITQGQPETARTNPTAERLIRVPWIRPVIAGWAELKVWWELRESSRHWNIWHSGVRYVVIVKALAQGGYLLKTAYPTGPYAAKWHRRFAEAQKTRRALADAP